MSVAITGPVIEPAVSSALACSMLDGAFAPQRTDSIAGRAHISLPPARPR
ncbi:MULTISPECIES: hypothetical protein [unclassified Streptosporangium]|nr:MULTISPECIES: hypothetical protein [unclassified Streptosporangium]